MVLWIGLYVYLLMILSYKKHLSTWMCMYNYMLYVYIYWSRREYSPLVLYCDTYQMDSIDIDTWA